MFFITMYMNVNSGLIFYTENVFGNIFFAFFPLRLKVVKISELPIFKSAKRTHLFSC